jgi:hypothetical protein
LQFGAVAVQEGDDVKLLTLIALFNNIVDDAQNQVYDQGARPHILKTVRIFRTMLLGRESVIYTWLNKHDL